MGRPRKDSNIPEPKERIGEAFWKLLKTTRLEKIGVQEICDEAGCSRSSFYRAFNSVEELFQRAVAREIFRESLIQPVVYKLAMEELTEEEFTHYTTLVSRRLMLAVNRGGMEAIQDIYIKRLNQYWADVLQIDISELKPKTKALLSYEASAIFNVMYQVNLDEDSRLRDAMPFQFLKRATPIHLECICYEQGVDKDEIYERLKKATYANHPDAE